MRDDDHAVEATAQEAHPPVDFAQPALPINVLGVFGSIALGGRFGDRLCHGGPLDAPKLVEFGPQASRTFGCHVLGAGTRRWPCARHFNLVDLLTH